MVTAARAPARRTWPPDRATRRRPRASRSPKPSVAG